jgi:hypothetical protein
MTEEEADALDEKWTKTTPKVGPNGSGYISKHLRIQPNLKTPKKGN